MKPVVVFQHIPKTAGSSFVAALKEVYGDRYLALTPHGEEYPTEIGNALACGGHIKAGHEIYAKLKDFVHLTILRDPVERVIDAYIYLIECAIHPFHEQALKTPFGEAVQNCHPNWGLTNLQTWFLSGLAENQASPAERLEAAKHSLAQFSLFGFVEDYGGFIAECNTRLGIPVKEKKVNMSTMQTQEFGEDIRDLIRERNRLDIELYEFARSLHVGS